MQMTFIVMNVRVFAWCGWIEHLQCWFKTISPSIVVVSFFSSRFISFQYFFFVWFVIHCQSISFDLFRIFLVVDWIFLRIFSYNSLASPVSLSLSLDHNGNEIQHLFIPIAESCCFSFACSCNSLVFAPYNGTAPLSWWREMIKEEWTRKRKKTERTHESSHSFWSEISFHFIAYLR